jgi:hypothetical protein
MHFSSEWAKVERVEQPCQAQSQGLVPGHVTPGSVVGSETHLGVPAVLCTRGGVYGRGLGWLHEL